MPAGWSIRSTAMMKPTIRFGLPNTHSGNPNGCFGKSNNRFGTPASLFDFNRNARSSSSENPVRHQLKSLFGFAEIRSFDIVKTACWIGERREFLPIGWWIINYRVCTFVACIRVC